MEGGDIGERCLLLEHLAHDCHPRVRAGVATTFSRARHWGHTVGAHRPYALHGVRPEPDRAHRQPGPCRQLTGGQKRRILIPVWLEPGVFFSRLDAMAKITARSPSVRNLGAGALAARQFSLRIRKLAECPRRVGGRTATGKRTQWAARETAGQADSKIINGSPRKTRTATTTAPAIRTTPKQARRCPVTCRSSARPASTSC